FHATGYDRRLRRADRVGGDRERRVGERRIAQSVAERKERLTGEIDIVVTPARGLVIIAQRQLARGQGERDREAARGVGIAKQHVGQGVAALLAGIPHVEQGGNALADVRSEEHTSELQSPCNLVCRLLLEKKNIYLVMLTDV